MNFSNWPFKILIRNIPSSANLNDIKAAFSGCSENPTKLSEELMEKIKKAKKTKKSDAKRNSMNQEITQFLMTNTPVCGIQLIKQDLDMIASKFLYDLPRNHSPLQYTDGITNIDDKTAYQESNAANSRSNSEVLANSGNLISNLPITTDNSHIPAENAYNFEPPKISLDAFKNIDNRRVKTTLTKVRLLFRIFQFFDTI
jgi:hypothetical protein